MSGIMTESTFPTVISRSMAALCAIFFFTIATVFMAHQGSWSDDGSFLVRLVTGWAPLVCLLLALWALAVMDTFCSVSSRTLLLAVLAPIAVAGLFAFAFLGDWQRLISAAVMSRLAILEMVVAGFSVWVSAPIIWAARKPRVEPLRSRTGR